MEIEDENGIKQEPESKTTPLEEKFLYCHNGYDKFGLHPCVIYDLGKTITSIDCFSSCASSSSSSSSPQENNLHHYLVLADNDVVKVLDTTTQEIKEFKGHRSPILSVKCGDGNEVITMSRDGGINIWNPWDTSGLVWKNSLGGSRYNLTSLAVSEKVDGILLATTKDGYVCAWNKSTSIPIHTSQIDSRGLFSSAICDTNNLLLVGGYGRLHIHDENFHSFSHVTTLGGHSGPIFAVLVANGYVATGGEDKSIIVHRLDTFHQVALRKNAHTSAVNCLIHYSESVPRSSPIPLTYLISGGRDNYIHIMTFPTLELLFSIQGHTGRISSLSFTPVSPHCRNRPALISCSSDNTLKIWKIYRSFNWERRKSFMMMLVFVGFIRLNVMKVLQSSFEIPVTSTASSSQDTVVERLEDRLLKGVLCNKGILQVIMTFI